MERNLGFDLVRATEVAALQSGRWMGRGDREACDQAAVDAMRYVLNNIAMDGIVVIGEGEKDEAPMLYIGERIGTGTFPEVDIAVDPVEGTSLLAHGQPGAIAVVAVANRGSLFGTREIVYMEKLVVSEEAADVVDLTAPVAENIRNVAKAKKMDLDDLTVVVLDRPRHAELIQDIRETGARINLIAHGDVNASIQAMVPNTGVDMLMGIGGAPEGVISACAARCLNGGIQCRLWPRNEEEREAALAAGLDLDKVMTVDDMAQSDDVFFAATGITNGVLLKGVRYRGQGAKTHSIVMRSASGTVRYLEADHRWDKLMRISDLAFDAVN
ncbi:MAG: class II fructose-bisphosphatase [Chloroflexia bacterium]|nr:class II fructose-bisphosphatase [Chloroflexia bacterium]